MESETVQVVRRFYEVIDSDSEAVLELLHADAEYVNPPDAVEPGTRRGPAQWMLVAASVGELIEGGEHALEQLADLGDGRVLASVKFSGRGRASGARVEHPEFHLVTVRDGKVVRFAWFNTRAEMLAAAGLED